MSAEPASAVIQPVYLVPQLYPTNQHIREADVVTARYEQSALAGDKPTKSETVPEAPKKRNKKKKNDESRHLARDTVQNTVPPTALDALERTEAPQPNTTEAARLQTKEGPQPTDGPVEYLQRQTTEDLPGATLEQCDFPESETAPSQHTDAQPRCEPQQSQPCGQMHVTSSTRQRAKHTQRSSNDTEVDPLRRVSGSSRVVKTHSRSKDPLTGQPTDRQRTAAPPQQPLSVSNIFQVLGWTLEQNQQRAAQEQDAHRQAQTQQLLELEASRNLLQHKLETTRGEKDGLSTQLREQANQISSQREKFTKLQRFVNGLGNDLRVLHEENKDYQKKCSALQTDIEEQRRDYEGKKQHFIDSIDKVSGLVGHVKRLESESQALILELMASNKILKRDLEEKYGDGAEQRNQRFELGQKLVTMLNKYDELKMVMDQQFNAFLEKHTELRRAIRTISDDTTAHEQVEKLTEVVQRLCNRKQVGTEDMQKLEGAIQSLAESFTSQINVLKASPSTSSAIEPWQSEFKDLLTKMNADLKSCQTLQTQVADLREAKAALDERSSNHERIVSELEQQLRTSREKEATLVEQIEKLERETDTLRQTMTSDDQLPARLRELEQQNTGLKHELEKSKADGLQAIEKTSVLVENDATLQSEVTKLEGQLC
ncbi:hypothetical protein LTS18_003946, partial [Coniosporium uncinatum]